MYRRAAGSNRSHRWCRNCVHSHHRYCRRRRHRHHPEAASAADLSDAHATRRRRRRPPGRRQERHALSEAVIETDNVRPIPRTRRHARERHQLGVQQGIRGTVSIT